MITLPLVFDNDPLFYEPLPRPTAVAMPVITIGGLPKDTIVIIAPTALPENAEERPFNLAVIRNIKLPTL